MLYFKNIYQTKFW